MGSLASATSEAAFLTDVDADKAQPIPIQFINQDGRGTAFAR
jgi:hypothetical protein